MRNSHLGLNLFALNLVEKCVANRLFPVILWQKVEIVILTLEVTVNIVGEVDIYPRDNDATECDTSSKF